MEREEKIYKNGQIVIKRFYRNDVLIREVNFKNGIRHGSEKMFMDDGSLFLHVNYKNNEKHGTYIQYAVFDGSKLIDANYKNGKKDGDFIVTRNDTKIKYHYVHKNGRLISETKTTW